MLFISNPTIERLSRLYILLGELEKDVCSTVSSADIGNYLGVKRTSIRKDLSFAGITGTAGASYRVSTLKQEIEHKLGFGKKRKSCVIGIGKLGSALLDTDIFESRGFDIVAGFDSNMNVLETRKTRVRLYPAYKIPEIVRQDNIEIAILCVPLKGVDISVERLVEGGVKGILNFTAANISEKAKGIAVKNIDIVNNLQVLSFQSSLSDVTSNIQV